MLSRMASQYAMDGMSLLYHGITMHKICTTCQLPKKSCSPSASSTNPKRLAMILYCRLWSLRGRHLISHNWHMWLQLGECHDPHTPIYTPILSNAIQYSPPSVNVDRCGQICRTSDAKARLTTQELLSFWHFSFSLAVAIRNYSSS